MPTPTVLTAPLGNKGHVGFSRETTAGVWLAPTNFMQVSDANVETATGNMPVETIYGSRASEGNDVQEETGASGTINAPLLPLQAATWISAAFGAALATSPADGDLATLSLEVYLGLAGLAHHVSGALIDKMSLKLAQKAEAKASWSFKAQQTVYGAATAPSVPVADQPYSPKDMVISLFGTADKNVVTLDIDLDNSVATQPTFNGVTYPSYIFSQKQTVKGKATIVVNSTTYLTNALANTAGAINVVLGSVALSILTVTMARIKITKVNDPIKVGSITVQDIDFNVYNAIGGSPTISIVPS